MVMGTQQRPKGMPEGQCRCPKGQSHKAEFKGTANAHRGNLHGRELKGSAMRIGQAYKAGLERDANV